MLESSLEMNDDVYIILHQSFIYLFKYNWILPNLFFPISKIIFAVKKEGCIITKELYAQHSRSKNFMGWDFLLLFLSGCETSPQYHHGYAWFRELHFYYWNKPLGSP